MGVGCNRYDSAEKESDVLCYARKDIQYFSSFFQ